MKRILLFTLCFLVFTGVKLRAQDYKCTIQNITLVSSSVLEFDVYLYSVTTDTIHLNGFQAGINFNYTGMANGGTITGSFKPNSSYDPNTASQLPAPMNAPNWNINATSHQIRLLAALITASSVAPILPNSAPGIKLGTFRMTNTVPFTSCTTPDFVWSFVTGSNMTKTTITAWVNSAPNPAAITTQTTFSYTNQGPQHFVATNPYVNTVLGTLTQSILACNSYTWHGNTYTTSGTYSDTVTTTSGCDSIYVLNLTIDTPSTTHYYQTSCNQYTWPLSGSTYTTSGNYSHQSTMPSGCIHTDILHLTINNSSFATTLYTGCDSYTWPVNGITYFTTGNYYAYSTNGAGCPDTQHLQLTLGHSNVSYDTISNCNSILWNGSTLSNSGSYAYNTTNASGCDSTAYLEFYLLPQLNDTQTVHSCGPYTVSGNTFTTSGTYVYIAPNQFGCVVTHVLYLTVGQNSYASTVLTSCGNLYYNGTLYTTSGSDTTIMTNATGCDSIISLTVNIHQPVTVTSYITACDSYTLLGNTYTATGVYNLLDTTAYGCDSSIFLHLTIKKSTSSYVNQTATSYYIWPVNGFIYYTSGIYTNSTVNSQGCSQHDTLNLTIVWPTGVTTAPQIQELSLYPNPAQTGTTLQWNQTNDENLHLKLLDISGRCVQQIQYAGQRGNNKLALDMSTYTSGMYFLEMWNEQKQLMLRQKLTKE